MKRNCGCSKVGNARNCGCNNLPSKKMLMVETSPSEASTCGAPGSSTGSESCPKQEPVYDVILSDFIVPSSGTLTSASVCNGSVYSSGQWIQTLNPVVTLKINSINGNILSLANQCDNGSPVPGNPDAGQLITSQTRFSIVSQPECLDEEERAEEILAALASATEVCTPSLLESSANAAIQPVGRVESDPSNTAAGKCIRRIFGIIFNSGIPYLTSLGNAISGTELNNYRRLGKHKTNNSVRQLENYSENPAISGTNQYALGIRSNQEYLVGPSYVPCFFTPILIDSAGVVSNTSSPVMVTSPTGVFEKTINLSGVSQINNIQKNQDHYYVHLSIEYIDRANNTNITVNNELVGMSLAHNSSRSNWRGVITAIVRVDISTNELRFKIENNLNFSSSSFQYAYRIMLKGIYA